MAQGLLETAEGRKFFADSVRRWKDAGCPVPQSLFETLFSTERWPHVVTYDGHDRSRYAPPDMIPGFTREHGPTWCQWFVPGTI